MGAMDTLHTGGIEKTAIFTKNKIIQIRGLMEDTMRMAKKKLPERVYSKELIELLLNRPYTKGEFLVGEGIAERKTAAGDLTSEGLHLGYVFSALTFAALIGVVVVGFLSFQT